ncbi:YitT family protein [Halalkalibacterium halodurans]|uniref:YitT family protein n=1 Tax=Halalkalibacterium halodurans TaxID=86665 RepID=UPI0010683A3C|nr:YitT family protein [Halalkalibacterium halodurans]TES51553.1 YitT family protein [Halalkalibacterium halodurans]
MKKWLWIFLGIVITSCGVILLRHANLVTGGTAGLSLGMTYLFNLPFALTFFLVNVPFYLFSLLRMGWSFTRSTIISVSLLSLVTSLDVWLPSFNVPVWLGAVFGGGLIGLGLSLIFMNGSSLGGANILALYLQKRLAIDPGKTNFLFDVSVVLLSMVSVGVIRGLLSILSIAVTSRIISYFKKEIASRQLAEKPKSSSMASTPNSRIPVAE